ncbi:MAG: hypothetical protein O2960_16970 [Verrucomicrobia bacterium]|nr:hypothetical protein [Verrucomicrobiota bacterium]
MKNKKTSSFTRRDFGKVTAAAFTGMILGASGKGYAADAGAKRDPLLLLKEPHVCRGLNACKGKGKGEKNTCAGQGSCASAKAHSCHAENDCKGQGGCGEHPGQNDCKGKGECGVPLSAGTWKKARAEFEKQMKIAKKEFGAAPKAKK